MIQENDRHGYNLNDYLNVRCDGNAYHSVSLTQTNQLYI